MDKDELNREFNLKEFSQKSDEFYNQIKAGLEANHKGKYVALDYEHEKYWIGETATEALTKAKSAFPDKLFYLVQVGASAPFKIQSINRHNSPARKSYGFNWAHR